MINTLAKLAEGEMAMLKEIEQAALGMIERDVSTHTTSIIDICAILQNSFVYVWRPTFFVLLFFSLE